MTKPCQHRVPDEHRKNTGNPPFRVPRSALRTSSGFTMLEILAVLLIFMILLGIAMYPAAKWHRQQRIRSGVAVVQSVLRLAREQAMTRRESVSVVFTNASEVVTNPVTHAVVTNMLGSYYWVQGPSEHLTLSNGIPNGVAFYTQSIHSTNGYDDVIAKASNPHHAVCIAGDSTNGDWVVFTVSGDAITFLPSGNVTSPHFIGIAESAQRGNDHALTGLLTIATTTGYITSDPASP